MIHVQRAFFGGPKIIAIGCGAMSAINKEGIEIHHVPKLRTAEGVTADLGEVSGSMLMLVRVEGTSQDLPRRLRGMGAWITKVVSYRMFVNATAERDTSLTWPKV